MSKGNISFLPSSLDRACCQIERDSRYAAERRRTVPGSIHGFRPADESFVASIEDWRVEHIGPAFISVSEIPDIDGIGEFRTHTPDPIESLYGEEFEQIVLTAFWQPDKIPKFLSELSLNEEILFWKIFSERIAAHRKLKQQEERLRSRRHSHSRSA